MKKILDIIFPFIGNWEAKKIIKGKMFPKNELGEETIHYSQQLCFHLIRMYTKLVGLFVHYSSFYSYTE